MAMVVYALSLNSLRNRALKRALIFGVDIFVLF